MTADAFSQSPLWWQGQQQPPSRLGVMLALSLLLHLAVLIVAGGFKLSAKMERPLASYQVSLVTLPPAPAPHPVQRVVEAEAPVVPPLIPAVPAPPPAPLPRAAKPTIVQPVAVPKPTPAQAPAPSKSETQIKDLLRGIKLPPQAPSLGDEAPAPKLAPVQRVQQAKADASQQKFKREIDELLSNIPVPESKPAVVGPAMPKETQAKQTLTQQMQNLASQALKPAPDETVLKRPAPIQQAKAAPSPMPATKLQVPGVATGFSAYLALVQRKISREWVAPPVDLTGKTYRAVVKFRLDRSGGVSTVAVETPSGNGYFDDAATRAVLRADPLPPFPEDLPEASLDAHFSFVVGEEVG